MHKPKVDLLSLTEPSQSISVKASISNYSLLLNNNPLNSVLFKYFRILYIASMRSSKGDSLSPYLFMIAMEVFSCFLRRPISGGFLLGWWVRGRSGNGIMLSHVLFADDTLVFCEASQDQMTYLS